MSFEEENRNLRNRPSFAVGMDDDDDDDMAIGGGLSMRQNSFNSAPMSPFSQSGFAPQSPSPTPFGGSGFGQPLQPMQPQRPQQGNVEDKFWDGAKGALNTSKSFLEAVQEAFSGHHFMSLAKSTRIMMTTSLVGGVVAVVGMLMGLFLPIFQQGFAVLIGCMLNCAVGFILYPFFYNKGRNEITEPQTLIPEPQPVMMNNAPEDDQWDDEPDSFDTNGFDDDDEEDDFSWDDPEPEEPEEPEEPDVAPVPDPVNPLQAMRDLPDFRPQTQTREALYNQYMRVLPFWNPNFQDAKEVELDSELGNMFQSQLTLECQKLGLADVDYAVIDTIRENGFMYTIRFSTTNKTLLNEKNRNEIANQIATQMMYDTLTGVSKPGYKGFTGRSVVIGPNVFLQIFKGSKSDTKVSLADASRIAKNTILDESMKMPVITGVGESADLHISDFVDYESLILTGQPRSGKSWQAQSIIAQMCMYTSPRDVIFEVYDVKATTSDYYKMAPHLPHFRVFRADPISIVDRMRYLVEVEAKRRSAILSQYNALNIKDLHKKYPQVDLPYLYIIIDEMATLSGSLANLEKSRNPEDKPYANYYKEYKSYLKQIATKTPNLGIRGIYIAHRLVDNIIDKTVHEMIGNKMLVRAPKDDIEKQLGKGESFTYSLVQPGDMGMKTIDTQNKMVYNHGLGITDDNDSNEDFYTFVGAVWSRFEPEFHVHKEQVTTDAVLNYHYVDVDYRKDPLGKGSNYSSNMHTEQPKQTLNSKDLFSTQIEDKYDSFAEGDDDDFFTF